MIQPIEWQCRQQRGENEMSKCYDIDHEAEEAKEKLPALETILTEAINAWPQFDTSDEEVSGADLVEWFSEWRERAKIVLSQ
jgi:hypothetical protein